MAENTIFKIVYTASTACFITLFGGLDILFKILAGFIVLDYTTGLLKAYMLKELSSQVGFKGLIKKIGIFIAVIVACQMDKLDPSGTSLFRTATLTFFVANEGISILENLTILGVDIPYPLKKALKIWKEKVDKDEEKDVI